MSYFKNSQNKLYWLDFGSDPVKWLPQDCQPITDIEAETIRISQLPPPPDPKVLLQQQITQLEAQQLMPRATREFMLLYMESTFTLQELVNNPGYVAVKDFDTQIAALRAQL